MNSIATILIVIMVLVIIALALTLAVILKKYTDLEVKMKEISNKAKNENRDIYVTSHSSDDTIREYYPIEDDSPLMRDFKIDTDHDISGGMIARITTGAEFRMSNVALDVYKSGNNILFNVISDICPVFNEIELLISKYLEVYNNGYKHVYVYSDYDRIMYVRTPNKYYDQLAYDFYEVANLEKSEFIDDHYVLCTIHVKREVEDVPEAFIHFYFDNVIKVHHANEIVE